MKSTIGRHATVLLVLVLAIAGVLAGCSSPPRVVPFKPQVSEAIEGALSAVHKGVPRALEGLGIEFISESPSKGKLTVESLSPSGVAITIKLEAMTSSVTQVQVHVRGYSTYGEWLAEQVLEAIHNEVAQASASPEGAASPRSNG